MKMSGTKIDLDAAREKSGFLKAKIVVKDIDNNGVTTPKQEEPSVPPIIEETLDEAMSRPVRQNSSSKAIISSDSKPAIRGSSKKSDTVSMEPPRSSTKVIANAIKEAIASSRKSERSSQPKISQAKTRDKPEQSSKSTKKPRLPENDKNKPVEPEHSAKFMEDIKEAEEEMNEDDIDMMPKTDSEKHLYWKTRLQILKTRFNDVTIPKNVAEVSWQELRKMYYIEMDRVSISKNVDSYKMIMIISFFVLEYIGHKYLKIDITGFSVHSMRTMYRYERLLIELGEKDYSSFAENWPVEARLFGMVFVNAIIFCIAKYLFKATGQDMSDDFFNMFQSMGNQSVEGELGPGAGMDTPGPNKDGGGSGGLMGMLTGLLGAFGGGSGGGGGLGGLGALFSGLGGGNKPAAAAPKPGTEDTVDEGDGNRVKPPTYRKKKKKPKAEN